MKDRTVSWMGWDFLRGEDPHLRAHLQHLMNWYGGIATATAGKAQEKHTWAAERATFVSERLRERGLGITRYAWARDAERLRGDLSGRFATPAGFATVALRLEAGPA